MVGRAWLWCVVLTAGLAHAEREYAFGGPWPTPVTPPPPPRFAAGSVVGPWSFQELGGVLGAGTFVDPELYRYAGLWTNLTAGWGFEAGPVHLRPAARFSLGYELMMPDDATGTRVSVTPVALSLAATNLIDDPRTGLRLTPVFGLTVPTALSASIPLTTLSLALQLERRFGPVELALRSEVGKPLYVAVAPNPRPCIYCTDAAQPGVSWSWGNSLQVEGWITDSLSLGVSVAWNIAWRAVAPNDPNDPNDPYAVNPIPHPGLGRSDRTTARLFGSWAFTRLFGLSLEVDTTQTPLFVDRDGVQRVRFPFLSLGAWADNATVFFLSVWFRTDVALARNWIER